MLKSKFSLSRHLEYANGNIVEESFFDKYFAEKLKVPTII
jgi:hypothetical protein